MESSFLSVVDLDGTFAAGDPAVRKKVRAMLESMGAFVFCTARTPELVMSRRSYELSKSLAGFTRSEPTWLVSDGVRFDAPLDTLPADEKDPDAILSFGQGIYIGGLGHEQSGARPYFCDQEYRYRYLDPVDSNGNLLAGKPWLAHMRELLQELNLQETRFDNVDETDFRTQVDFYGKDAVIKKYEALAAIEAKVPQALRGRLEGVDESKPSDDPEKNRATLYGLPPQIRKENMINYALSQACRAIGRSVGSISGLIIGDTLTDFYAACHAGWDADMTGIIVGGSRISKCIEEKTNFAGVDLRRWHAQLEPTGRRGFYTFNNPAARGGWIKNGPTRLVVLGDQAYPGTIGSETIEAYLLDREVQKLRTSAH